MFEVQRQTTSLSNHFRFRIIQLAFTPNTVQMFIIDSIVFGHVSCGLCVSIYWSENVFQTSTKPLWIAFFSRWIFEWRLKNFDRFSSSIFCTFTFILFLLLENSNQFWLILLFVLYFFQLIGWQEVPRPNSRSEIVQAMRQIRVCIAKWMSISLLQIIQQQQKQ